MTRLIALSLAALAVAAELRGEADFCRGWIFSREGSNGVAVAARTVDLPHDGAIDSDFDPKRWSSGCGALPYHGHGEYRKTFTLPDDGRRWRLEFDGVMSHARVYVNGRLAAYRPFGYAAFRVPLDGFARPGENEVRVTVDPPPDSSRWYPGFGIYRDVRLVGVRGDCVRPGTVSFVPIEVTGERARIRASWTMEAAGPTSRVITVEKPRTWSPEDPFLYEADLGGERFRYGIRTLRYDKTEGFFLNGVHRQMRGVCLHHDLGLFGAAYVPEAARRNLLKLKEMGCDAIRTSHNPPAPAFLDLCDELGFMVMVESFDEWAEANVRNGMSKLWKEHHARELEDIVGLAMRHPSVVMWSVGNELIEDFRDPAIGSRIAAELTAIVRRCDPEGRPATAGHFHEPTTTNGIGAATDVFGGNYLPYRYASFRGRQSVVGTETCSTVSSRGVYGSDVTNKTGIAGQVDSHDLCTMWPNDYSPDVEFAAQEANPHVIGEFVWTGFDYLGEPDPWRDRARSSYFGIFDLAGFPKDRYWLYRAQWRPSSPSAHILPHWNGKAGDRPDVHVYSSGDTAELFVNGRSRGVRRRGDGGWKYRFVWEKVAWEPGVVSVRVRKDGKPWATDEVRTSGPFSRFVFSDERLGRFIFRTAKAVDAEGNFVPTAAEEVKYEVPAGYRVRGTCNGDAMERRSLASPKIRSFSGLALIVFEALR